MIEKQKNHLTLWICCAIVAAIIAALVLPHFAMRLHVGGEVFLRLLKMMVVPLVVISVMNGIFGLGDVRKLGRSGGSAVLYYLSTTAIAVFIGLVTVNIIQPGVGTRNGVKWGQSSKSNGVKSNGVKSALDSCRVKCYRLGHGTSTQNRVSGCLVPCHEAGEKS